MVGLHPVLPGTAALTFLEALVFLQDLDTGRGRRDARSERSGSGYLDEASAVDALDGAVDGGCVGVVVDFAPMRAEQFAAAHVEAQGEFVGFAVDERAGFRREGAGLGEGERFVAAGRSRGDLDLLSDAARQQVLAHGAGEGRREADAVIALEFRRYWQDLAAAADIRDQSWLVRKSPTLPDCAGSCAADDHGCGTATDRA